MSRHSIPAHLVASHLVFFFFFFNDTATTEIYTLSLHDALPICAAQQIALPMAGNGTVLNFRGPFPDGDGINDLTAGLSADTRVPRAAYTPLGPQVPNQLLFQRSARLNEQTAVNGLVGHAHTLVVGILGLQPSGNLLRRPVQNQFTRNDLLQLPVD